MRIAIVAPSPDPFRVDGAGSLWRGMLRHLNQETDHLADLIKLPVRERTLLDLVAGYESFANLDLSGFDQVITTRYPAWLAHHPNHVVYVEGRAYCDRYPQDGEMSPSVGRGASDLLAFVERHRGERAALAEFFSRVRSAAAAGAPEWAAHPGPLWRVLARFLDEIALAPTAIRRYAAVSAHAKRLAGFLPRSATVQVVHPPGQAAGPEPQEGEYFLAVGPLEAPRRIDLLIDAYRLAGLPHAFKIAGDGEDEARLRERARGDARFEFLGFLGAAELEALRAGALAVACAPDEAMSASALEAMLAGKPVITVNDAGGLLELLTDADTGIVVAPEPDAIAAAFRRVAADPQSARDIGRRGRERARRLTWSRVCDVLIGDARPAAATRKRRPPRPRVTVLNAYSVHPPDSGGRYRLHSLYKALSRRLDVDLVTLGLHHQGDDVIWADEGLRELRVARSRAHAEADQAAHAGAHVPVYDITALENIELTPAYLTVLENSLAGSAAVVVSHPYMLEALRKTGYRGRFLFEAHNCEHALKQGMLPDSPLRERLLRLVEETERDCCRDAALTFATSDDDAAALQRQYGSLASDMVVIPNGTDTRRIDFAPHALRRRLKRRLGLPEWPIALFLASGHGPNLRSAERLFATAAELPDVAFALVGSVADAFTHATLPANVWRVGMVSEEARNVWLHASDVALNPVLHGSGTNLKLLDYFAAGTPVVSTEIGVRGTGMDARELALVAPIEDFGAAIRRAVARGDQIEAMVSRARAVVEERFDWAALADRLYAEMRARALI